jgi:hypothetical protein
MSTALWCDPGEHAFKGGEPGSQSFDGSRVNEDGHATNVRVDVCAKHAFQTVLDNPKALPSEG